MHGNGTLQIESIDHMMKTSEVLIVGALPPPVHGMGMINKMMTMILNEKTKVYEINVSPQIKFQSINFIFKFFNTIHKSFWSIRFFRKWDVLYVGLSGGLGQIHESFFILIARLFKKRIFLHHHSFAYINKYKIHFRILCMIAGSKCTHITLSEGMRRKLMARYNLIKNTRVVSNSAFIESGELNENVLINNLKVGFLSNISFDKGISLFFEAIEKLIAEGISVNVKIAGPFEDKKVEKFVLNKLKKHSNIEYLGPIYDENKKNFFNEINVLMFPTQYKNEAEPLTIHECFSYGIPVISLNRGCIPEMMSDFPHLCISHHSKFSTESFKIIIRDFLSVDTLQKVSREVKFSFNSQKTNAKKNLENLIQEIIN